MTAVTDLIEVAGLITGPHMVRSYRERIADLEAMLRIAAQDAWDNVRFIEELAAQLREEEE